MRRLALFTTCCLACFGLVQGQPAGCSGNTFMPALNYRANRSASTGAAHTGLTVIAVGKGTIDCLGRIDRWEFWYNTGQCDDLALQVWRPTGNTDEYELVGENSHPSSAGPCGGSIISRSDFFNVGYQDQIPVRPGDVVGWRQTTGNGMLVYDENSLPGSNTYGVMLTSTNCTPTAAGQMCSFTDQRVMDYSLAARLIQDERPRLDNPETDSIPDNFLIREDLAVGVVIYTVKASARETHTPMLGHRLYYKLESYTPRECREMVEIGQFSGEIKLISAIDRSKLTAADRECLFTVYAEIDDLGAATNMTKITVELGNLPHTFDNSVTIPNTIQLDTLSTPPKPKLLDLQVTDPDYNPPLGVRRSKTFTIEAADPDASIFRIDQNVAQSPPPPQPHPDNLGELYCEKDLTFRREDEPRTFQLNITSSDGTHVTGPVSVRVEVTNLRVPPVLSLPPASRIVKETKATPNPALDLAPVTCTCDGNSTYTVTIHNQYPLHETRKFQLSASPGRLGSQIQLMPGVSLDYDVTDKYQVEVEVSDDNMNGYTDRANLTVEVERVNQKPNFTGPNPLTASMDEEQNIDTPVAGLVLEATDRDTKYGDSLAFSIQPGGTWADKFYIPTAGNQLYVRTRIDVDPNRMNFTATVPVQVTDQEGLTDSRNVVITIHDINDNAPIFPNSSYSTSIPENTYFGRTLGTFTATDNDAGRNAEIEYSIENSPTGAKGDYYFDVDGRTGELTVKHPVDYEQYTNVSFKVKATDKGQPALSGSMDMLVAVQDVNNNRPAFSRALYNVEVPSDVPLHTTVAAVLAHDADSAAVSEVRYFLLRPDDRFHLSSVTGAISTTGPLADDTKHFLYCYARDQGTNPKELFSDPSIVRIDVFQPGRHLVDMTLDIPLGEFTQSMEKDLVDALNNLLTPWVVKVWMTQASNDQSKITFYVLENTATDDLANLEMTKPLVHRDIILQRLRENQGGFPSAVLRTRDFAKFRPVLVAPTHPDWVTETPAGTATVVVLVLLAVAAMVTVVILMKKFHVWPFKPKLTTREPHRIAPMKGYNEEFKLGYDTEKKNTQPVVIPPKTAGPVSTYREADVRQRTAPIRAPTRARASEAEPIHEGNYP